MAKLSLERRDKLAGASFGLPGRRAFPITDRSHAANAKARASQQVGKSITPAQKATIDAKANKVLGKSSDPKPANVLTGANKRNADPKAKGTVHYASGK